MKRDPVAVGLDADDPLQPARAALAAGNPPQARELVLSALAQAEAALDHPKRAKALLMLAHIDRLASHFRASHASARQAAKVFRTLGDAVGESGALSTLAHAASCLGHNEEAIESALISVRLSRPDMPAAHRAMLFNYLGVAYLWSRDFAKAKSALEIAIELAEDSNGEVSAFQPLINALLTDALDAVSTRHQHGSLPPAAVRSMIEHHRRCASAVKQSAPNGLFQGSGAIGVASWLLCSSLVCTWTGDLDTAAPMLTQARARLASLPDVTLTNAFEFWFNAEYAWARRDLRQALHCANAMVELSQRLEYEQMACIGHLLISQLHEELGETEHALQALRQLRQRESMIRAESLESRERAVQWHLDLREVERNVRTLEGVSRHLERLSLEDSLTGLANRRSLEQALRTVLAARSTHGAPMSIAFIDVDQFKRVNDEHSHRVGDQVLKAIATILLQATRENDMAARLSGDEFAILFQRADASEAAAVCERIGRAVRQHAWHDLAAGLAVTVSIGTATARDGDNVDMLLHRGDSAMYAAKRASRA